MLHTWLFLLYICLPVFLSAYHTCLLYTSSNGNTVANPKYLERSMRKLVREQRRLSRREKGSHNRDKQRIRVAKVHEKVTNQRNDFLQKQSTMLVCENQTICIEAVSYTHLRDTMSMPAVPEMMQTVLQQMDEAEAL